MSFRTLLLILAAASGAGCFVPKVQLPMLILAAGATAQVEVEDLRPAENRRGFSTDRRFCARVWGDDTSLPSTVEYLRSQLAARLAPGQQVHVRVERLDVIDRCDRTAAANRQRNWENWGVGGAPRASIPQDGDNVALQFVGIVNGAPLRFRGAFDYRDTPPHSEKYRARLARLFEELAAEIGRPLPSSNVAASELVDVGALRQASLEEMAQDPRASGT